MKRSIVLSGLLLAAVVLTACGAAAPATESANTAPPVADTAATEVPATEETATEETTATESAPPAADTTAAESEATVGHDMAGMDMNPATAFDMRFIDSMIPHHQGAVAMAQQALEQAEHPEIKQLAQQIIDAQQAEIAQLQGWRSAWYQDAPMTEGMDMQMGGGMDMMAVMEGDEPFDLRFIDSMIPHHQDAIMMAQEALAQSQHDEVKQMAQQIIDAQQTEIEQLQQWRAAWYPDAP